MGLRAWTILEEHGEGNWFLRGRSEEQRQQQELDGDEHSGIKKEKALGYGGSELIKYYTVYAPKSGPYFMHTVSKILGFHFPSVSVPYLHNRDYTTPIIHQISSRGEVKVDYCQNSNSGITLISTIHCEEPKRKSPWGWEEGKKIRILSLEKNLVKYSE